MRKALIIGLAVMVVLSMLSGCIGDESETTPSVESVNSGESNEEIGTTTPQNPPEGSPQNPPEGSPQNPPLPMNLEEPTSEEEEEAKRIALEDERVQDLIQGGTYDLEAIGCMLLPSGDRTCLLRLELENGDTYTITINLSSGVVMDVREGEIPPGREGESGNG
ncbi:MAG: hypothetical protein HXS41_06465 [Theionarchaea archaeon]|nr:hypothetical protein [Theionarchaea archaeon]MBU7020683.1 hypothetical protein [Theionarchaea archaeon]MBU7034649.1 hypothetical protein [Theionarchaea archaeon]MBU7039857.1 hypothetical protein [Theionarchaea archaeon]